MKDQNLLQELEKDLTDIINKFKEEDNMYNKPLSQRQLGDLMEKKFKEPSHVWITPEGETVSLIGVVNFQFGLDEKSFERGTEIEDIESTNLWKMIMEARQ